MKCAYCDGMGWLWFQDFGLPSRKILCEVCCGDELLLDPAELEKKTKMEKAVDDAWERNR